MSDRPKEVLSIKGIEGPYNLRGSELILERFEDYTLLVSVWDGIEYVGIKLTHEQESQLKMSLVSR